MQRTRSARLPRYLFLSVLAGLACLGGSGEVRAVDPPYFYVVGGVSPGGQFQSGTFTWLSQPVIYGTGFTPGVAYQFVLHGPINSIGVAPDDRVLESLFADTFGNLNGIVHIPYEDLATVNQRPDLPRIPRPGRYQVKAIGPSNEIFARNDINLSPETIPTSVFSSSVNWPRSRGGRDGWLDDNSPERTDPEWPSVWDERPIGLYATVAATNDDPRNQPVSIAHHEFPGTHYAHDINLNLVPDEEYGWVLGTANFIGDPGDKETGRIELEWETQNDGNPQSYGEGVIGLPLWATATAGDRVYTVGRWVMDNGHPDTGDRTEVHPPRLLATMRKRDTALPLGTAACMTRASRVDVYVSGHGGGANRFYDRLFAALDNHDLGGGRFEDVTTPGFATYNQYYAFGPADDALITAIMAVTGQTATVWTVAGPSGMATDASGLPVRIMEPEALYPWVLGPEERPINDMDYDFDVPLPPAPAGATSVVVHVTTQPEHDTAVQEEISYVDPDPATGLPTKAHIHLPYLGADNGIYARTLEFSWDTFSLPGKHFVVTMNDLVLNEIQGAIIPTVGAWNMWADINGEWSYLSGLDPSLLGHPLFGTVIDNLEAASFDTYLDPDDSLRVLTLGYEAHDFEDLFEVGRPVYEVGHDIVFAQYLGTGDNVHIGAALFEDAPSPASAGPHSVVASNTHYLYHPANGLPFSADFPLYTMDLTVAKIPTPGHLGTHGSADFGSVCVGDVRRELFAITNIGEAPLDVASIDVSGGGYSGAPNPPAPYSLTSSAAKLDVTFAPTAIDQGPGAITIGSSDACEPSHSIPLTADVIYPLLRAVPATTVFPETVAGCSNSVTVTVSNAGECDLAFDGATMQGEGYSVDAPGLPMNLAPGASTELTVTFAPEAPERALSGVLSLFSNDPVNPQTTVAFCGEAVPNGMRLLVVHDDGTPWPLVDRVKVTSHGVTPNSNGPSLHNVQLTTIDPPASCEPLNLDLDVPLPPTDPSDPSGSFYDLRVQIGHTVQSMNFTLGTCELKHLTIPLEPRMTRARGTESQREIITLAPR